MTAVLGVKCSDGVIIGADRQLEQSLPEFGQIQHTGDKIAIFENDNMIIVGAGEQHLIQRFVETTRSILDKSGYQFEDAISFIQEVYRQIKTVFRDTERDKNGELKLKTLIAFAFNDGHHLYYFDKKLEYHFITSPPLYKALGNGTAHLTAFMKQMNIILERGEETELNLHEGKFHLFWAFNNTLSIAPGSFSQIDVVTLERKDGQWVVSKLSLNELKENLEYIQEAKDNLASFLLTKERGAGNSPEF